MTGMAAGDGLVLGVDTSAYTTSLALLPLAGLPVADLRRVLPVPPGRLGLRQQEAVFHHVVHLGELMEEARRVVGQGGIVAVAASTRPRPVEASYLPVFRVGEAFGRAMAAACAVPFFPTSHQEGHLAAALLSTGEPPAGPFLAVHLSGGTTELLLVQRVRCAQGFFRVERLGGTVDLYAGQFVDRVGVAAGLPFPAGPHLEALAEQAEGAYPLPVAARGLTVSFAGPATAALRALAAGVPAPQVARGVFRCLALSLAALLRAGRAAAGVGEALVVGGVAASRLLRSGLEGELAGAGLAVRYADPRLSTDNAVGVAALGREALQEELAGECRTDQDTAADTWKGWCG